MSGNQLLPTDLVFLVLGETGIGKSTFINALANYLTFNSLDEAVNSEYVVSVIPSKFKITDENFRYFRFFQ